MSRYHERSTKYSAAVTRRTIDCRGFSRRKKGSKAKSADFRSFRSTVPPEKRESPIARVVPVYRLGPRACPPITGAFRRRGEPCARHNPRNRIYRGSLFVTRTAAAYLNTGHHSARVRCDVPLDPSDTCANTSPNETRRRRAAGCYLIRALAPGTITGATVAARLYRAGGKKSCK